MNFDSIFKEPDDNVQLDPKVDDKAGDPLEQKTEIERLKHALKNVNCYSGTTKANTLKALGRGEPLEEIFIDLCEGVALMTGEPLFYENVKRYLKQTTN